MARYLVTGGAGFIGSALVHALAARGEAVRVLDDFSTGRRANLAGLPGAVEAIAGSICDGEVVARAMAGVEFVLHQAAIPSVPRSIADPIASNRANVEGMVQVLAAAQAAGVRRVVYASSSSVYGLSPAAVMTEDLPVAPISPYGASKAADELYAGAFAHVHGLDCVGLRYFNVFGPRQDPDSPYAAVVPLFARHLLRGEPPTVHGDGLQARDFTYVENVVAANLAACAAPGRVAGVYNVACGRAVTLLELLDALNTILGTAIAPVFGPARPGDIRRSHADVSRAAAALGYRPAVGLDEGLRRTVDWMRQEGRA